MKLKSSYLTAIKPITNQTLKLFGQDFGNALGGACPIKDLFPDLFLGSFFQVAVP